MKILLVIMDCNLNKTDYVLQLLSANNLSIRSISELC